MAIAIGEVVSGYEVLGRLGVGGMGEVYKVRHQLSGRIEALKVILPETSGGELPQRFLREIRVLAGLTHPHIAGLHTALRHEGQLLMLMEFVDGETLHACLRGTSVALDDAVRYLSEVLSALEYAHGQGVIHRDIKPSNIMITPQGKAKLLDFGTAFQHSEPGLTRQGLIVGSLYYMAPEQIRGEGVDARSDIYSTGVTLYEVLTGRLPLEGTNEFTVLMGHLNRPPRPPADLNPSIPAGLSATVLRALAKDPGQRFQSAAEFLGELQMHRHASGTTMLPRMITIPHTAPSGSGSGPAAFEAKALEGITRELAACIGPVARVVVKRAASQCATLEELCAKVAGEIESAPERARFLSSARRL